MTGSDSADNLKLVHDHASFVSFPDTVDLVGLNCERPHKVTDLPQSDLIE